ncbi:MAG TPA: hypothetical protein PLX89_07225 [Verrucomicrobiota bacterium]|nr:hypothetical protein [Verrucomicrobiales bacterium]HRI12782.1 hypothetical protein [Verrucomicrobiota bacterium]
MTLWSLFKQIFGFPRRVWIAWKTALAEARIRKSLQADNCLLAYTAAGIPFRDPNIPDSTDHLFPEMTIRATGFDRYVPTASAELAVVFEMDGEKHTLYKGPVELKPRGCDVGGLAIKWCGTYLARRKGPATIRFLVAERELAAFPITLIGSADLAAKAQVSDFRLNADLERAEKTESPSRSAPAQLNTIAPSFCVNSPILAPNTELTGRLILFQGDQLLLRAPFRWKLARHRTLVKVKPTKPIATFDLSRAVIAQIEIMQLVKLRCPARLLTGDRVTNFEGALVAEADTFHAPGQ